MRILLASPVETSMLRGHLVDAPHGLGRGHGGTLIADLCVALAGAGHEVTVITLDEGIEEVQRASGPNLTYVGVPMRSDGRGWDLWAQERRGVAAEVARHEADVVHAHWAFEYAVACLGETRPFVVTAHDWPPHLLRHNLSPFWVPRLALAARVMAARPTTTTPGPEIRDLYRRRLRQEVELIPNGVPTDMIIDTPRTRPDQPVVLSVANGFVDRKNTAMLLRAWPAIRAAVPDAVLRLMGHDHGPDGTAHAWAARSGLDLGGVEFVGNVTRDRVLREMSTASVLAHPALAEPFGMVIIEAMARGTPVVACTGSGGPPHIVGDGRWAPLVPPDEPGAMAAAVIQLLEDDDLWARRSVEGLDRVAEEFTIDAVAEAYVAFYERLRAARR